MQNEAGRTVRVVHVISSLGVGGAERMLAKLVSATSGSRIEHRVVCLLGPGPTGDRLVAEGVGIEYLNLRQSSLLVSLVKFLPGLIRLVRLLRTSHCDVVQTWLYHADLVGLLAARLAGVPRVAWNIRCSEMRFGSFRPTTRWVVWLLARISRLPDLVITNSLAGRQVHESLGYRVSEWRIIPNGIDLGMFRPSSDLREEFRRTLGLNDSTCVVGMIARYDPMKDFEGLISAFSVVRHRKQHAHLVLVGTHVNEENAELMQALSRHDLSTDCVHLLGECDSVERILPGLDVFVLASFGEGFPTVVTEAMACGVPVVSTDVGDVRQIVAEGGYVLPVGDTEAMADAILRILNSTALREQVGQCGSARVEKEYALARIVEQYDRTYLDLAA